MIDYKADQREREAAMRTVRPVSRLACVVCGGIAAPKLGRTVMFARDGKEAVAHATCLGAKPKRGRAKVRARKAGRK